ncbi:HXXEE domain-containing protein [Radiobacillus deserti]|uniref:HXXEE domain-containing protein n=1 Tax=Radiobacillus deserti TaxID=2594883 RepID=A0A516KF25_9BACI|nr:HXXEE domain-containing protein [Radiobacillus deserti]QDP39957.1 HXXEE domain-containing protein [Radiobacillus deserti]
MEQYFSIQNLIWLFPIVFIFHDFEEIIMVEGFMKKHSARIRDNLPPKVARRVLEQFSMSTAQFSVAVLVIFVFVSSSTYTASQYISHSPLGNIHFFVVMMIVFFVHIFTHLFQAIYLRVMTPGVVTSIFLVLPYSSLVLFSLLKYGYITWHTIWLCIPFSFLIIPVVLSAHWIGKKVI